MANRRGRFPARERDDPGDAADEEALVLEARGDEGPREPREASGPIHRARRRSKRPREASRRSGPSAMPVRNAQDMLEQREERGGDEGDSARPLPAPQPAEDTRIPAI